MSDDKNKAKAPTIDELKDQLGYATFYEGGGIKIDVLRYLNTPEGQAAYAAVLKSANDYMARSKKRPKR